MRILAFLTISALSACGVDGPPERPASKPQSGVSISGHATIGTITEL